MSEDLVQFIPASSMIKEEVQREEAEQKWRRMPGDISPEEAQALPKCGICEHHVKMSSAAKCYDDQGTLLTCQDDCGVWFKTHQACSTCPD